jgi:hypothetical protein
MDIAIEQIFRNIPQGKLLAGLQKFLQPTVIEVVLHALRGGRARLEANCAGKPIAMDSGR